MKPVSNETLVQQLGWRYATKKFDPARKITEADWHALRQALVMAPSSFGLQPWRFYLVSDPAKRQALREAAWNQAQITDASHLVVLAGRTSPGAADVQRHIDRVAQVRGLAPQTLDGYRDMMLSFINRPKEQFDASAWAARQVYIALGTLLTSAAMLGIDACPMEGLDPAKFDQILSLETQGYHTLSAVALGYRADDDAYAKLAKVRFDPAEVVVNV